MPVLNRSPLSFAVALSFLIVTGASAQERTAKPPAELAADLRSRDAERVIGALNQLHEERKASLGKGGAVSKEVSSALIHALEQEMEQVNRSYLGEPFNMLGEELFHGLTLEVVALKDPASIPVLLNVTGLLGSARDGLLDFGPRVIPVALDYVMSPDSPPMHVSGCMDLLAKAHHLWGDAAFDARTRARMREAVLLHLEGPPEHFKSASDGFYSLTGGIVLATQLGDADLIEKVLPFATDEEAWRSRGVEPGDHGFVFEFTQKRLSGEWPYYKKD